MIERYCLPAMSRVWGEENKYQKWLDVEIAACEAQEYAWIHQGSVADNACDVGVQDS
jgi:adenylosuccinate lyase